jgi:hypothetical protein
MNRGNKQSDWLAPSLKHRVDTTMAWVCKLSRLAPISGISQELVRFDGYSITSAINGNSRTQGSEALYDGKLSAVQFQFTL